jgi:hypothetical protein
MHGATAATPDDVLATLDQMVDPVIRTFARTAELSG